MKHNFIIFSLFLLSFNSVYAFDNFYYQPDHHLNRYFYSQNNRYTPYQYSSFDRYRQANKDDLKRIERIEKIRALDRLNNFISRKVNQKRFNNGTMTGYSVPINKNNYNQTVNTPMYDNYKKSFSQDTTELYSMPSGSEYNYDDGRMYRKYNEVSGNAGVRIIYD